MTILKCAASRLGRSVIILVIVAGCTPAFPAVVSTKTAPTPNRVSDKDTSPAQQIVLKVSGSGTTSTLLEALAPVFEVDIPGYRLDVLPGTETAGGVEGTIKGVLDVAAMARPLKPEEAEQQMEYQEIGTVAVAVFTHPDVAVTGLTREQIAAIFAGTITNWSAVGGQDLPIVVYVRNEEESSTKLLREAVFGDTAFPTTVARLMTSQIEMLTVVAGTKGSVGFGSWPVARATQARVQATALDGIAPGDPAYPIVTPVGIGYLQSRKADVQPLIDWLLSEEGQLGLRSFDVGTVRE